MAFMYDLGALGSNGQAFQGNGDDNGPRQIDPASTVNGAPPNFGQFVVPHVLSFTGTVSSLSRVYRPGDEAIRDSLHNARAMRNDLVVMECVEARQRSAALLNVHVAPPDEKNGSQKALAGILQKMLESIPRFMQYRENLLHGVYFGRYANAQRWRWKTIAGGQRITVDKWRPVHGDKLVWRYQADDHRWDEDQVGIRVGLGYGGSGNTVAGRWPIEKAANVEATEMGLAYFLRHWERPLLAIHKHYIEDGEFESPENAGRIHGLGIRSRIYWTWYQKQETLAWLMEYLERSAGGFEVWFYPWGNDAAKAAVEKSARERMSLGRNQLLVPKFLENDQFGQWYDRIEPGMAGAEALKSIIVEYFGHLLKRYILGQTLTTESSGTGLGSNLADVHLATFLQIIKYDATNLEETLTTDLLEPMIRFNFPWAIGLPFRVRIDTESENSHEKLEAFEKAYNMGLKLRAQDIYDIIGATKPQPGDDLLDKSTQQPEPGAGGLAGLAGLFGGGDKKDDTGPSAMPPSSPAGQVGDGGEPEPAPAANGDNEHYSAAFVESKHPRDAAGEFSSKGGGKLPGLPALPERKVDWSRQSDFAAAMVAADKRGGQFKSQAGQRGLFEQDAAQVDQEHLAPIEAAEKAGTISPEQSKAAAAWVGQHGHHPAWHVLQDKSLFGGSAALIGRVDRGDESFAVHVEGDGNVSVYHWPGHGKQKSKRFAGKLAAIGSVGLARSPANEPARANLLFSRSHSGAVSHA